MLYSVIILLKNSPQNGRNSIHTNMADHPRIRHCI